MRVAMAVKGRLLARGRVPARPKACRGSSPITGTTLSTCPDLIRALAAIKQAAALANHELGLLDAAAPPGRRVGRARCGLRWRSREGSSRAAAFRRARRNYSDAE
jgi:hypothetical protein